MSLRIKSKRRLGQILLSFVIASSQSSALATNLYQNGTDPLQTIPQDQRARFKDRLDLFIRYKEHHQTDELFKMFDSKTKAAILADQKNGNLSKDSLESAPTIKFLEIKLDRIVPMPMDKNCYSLTLISTIKKKEDNYAEESQIPCRLVATFEQNDWYFSTLYLLHVHN